VLSSEMIEHIPDWQKAISEMVRVLKPGGDLVLTTPNKKSLYGLDRYFVYKHIKKRKWAHPYDEWKTFKQLKKVFLRNNLSIQCVKGICYVSGFTYTYNLSSVRKNKLISFVKKMEPFLGKFFPKNGYMIAISAKK
jgi:2-polyprenyl-3-methyl-5-hydroxy-6-metoxy-1,4-benzoquinol methylase